MACLRLHPAFVGVAVTLLLALTPAERASGLSFWSVAIDSTGVLYATAVGGAVFRVDSTTGDATPVGRTNAGNSAFDAQGNLIGVARRSGFETGTLASLDITTAIRTPIVDITPAFRASTSRRRGPAVAIEASGDILVSTFDPNAPDQLLRVDPVTGQQTLLTSVARDIQDLALEASGSILLANQELGQPQILRVDPSTGAQTLLADLSLVKELRGITLGPTGIIYATGTLSGNDSAVIQVDPITGAETLITTGGTFEGGLFSGLVVNTNRGLDDIVVEPGGTLVVNDRGTNHLIRIDPLTGAQSFVFASEPSGLALVAIAALGLARRRAAARH